MKELLEWTESLSICPYPKLALAIIATIESIFFPIPPDVLLIALCIIAPQKSLLFSTITTIFSVFGGCLGYLLGRFLGLPILKKFISEDKIKKVHDYFQRYEGWAVGIAAFTPIPYKVFTVSAGVFYVNFKIFLLASLLGRGGRFFLVGLLFYYFGHSIKPLLYKYFDWFCICFIILLIGGFIILKKGVRECT